jgi:hypothetical protein
MSLSFNQLNAQNSCGIYLSAKDFTDCKLSHSGQNSKIKVHETFKKDIVEVKCNDSLLTFKKKDIFGYRDKNGQSYRFSQDVVYPILNPCETIVLYKKTTGMDTKSSEAVDTYYFSKDAFSSIIPLSLRNLESTFANNKTFVELLEVHFADNSNLLEYDNIHKMYKLNRLLELSKTGKIN